jgi:hypothetical protein
MIVSLASSKFAPLRIALLFAMSALPLLMLSCGQPQAIQISVTKAVLTDRVVGELAMDIYLDTKSEREFALFTTKYVGHLVEVSFRDVVLSKPRLLTPIAGGIFEISVSANRGDDALNMSNAADVATKLSSSDAKVQVRVAD